jgi:hypothetical protein
VRGIVIGLAIAVLAADLAVGWWIGFIPYRPERLESFKGAWPIWALQILGLGVVILFLAAR